MEIPVGWSRRVLLWAALVLFAPGVRGEVYWSLPGFGGPGSGRSGGRLRIAETEEYWRERFLRNGVEYVMTGGICRMTPENFIRSLADWTPPPEIAVFRDGLLLVWREDSGGEERFFWRPPAGNFPGIWFHLRVPEERRESVRWPKSLPVPGGMTPVNVLEYPERGSVFVEFSAPGRGAGDIFTAWAAALRSGGWESLSGEGNLPGASGEMLRNSGDGRIALISASEAGGVIYIRSGK